MDEHKKISYTFYVAECMEYNNLGKLYVNISNVHAAIKKYNEIENEAENMGPGIGIIVKDDKDFLHDDSYVEIYSNGMVVHPDVYDSYFNGCEELNKDVEILKNHFESSQVLRPAKGKQR